MNFPIADCQQPNCLRCSSPHGCIKCTKFIMSDDRSCVEECPSGSIHQWSSTSELMGRVCYRTNVTNPLQTIVIGTLCGSILCFIIVLLGVLVFKRKQQKIHKKSIKESLIDEEYDKNEFFRQLDELRPHAECFLHMLNDTRRQIRKLHNAGDGTASAKFYPIIRDLAKILILLNRPVELIDGPPHDWNRLLLWADRILAQYKPQQISQLIEFLQTPTSSQRRQNNLNIIDDDLVDSRFTAESRHTTFKSLFYSTPTTSGRKAFATTLPTIPASTSTASSGSASNTKDFSKRSSISDGSETKHLSLLPDDERDEKIASLISLQDFDDGKKLSATINSRRNPFGESFNHAKNYLSSGSLWMVEDEFIEFKLGLRPQDEITTEL